MPRPLNDRAGDFENHFLLQLGRNIDADSKKNLTYKKLHETTEDQNQGANLYSPPL